MASPAAVLSILVTANTGQATAQLSRLQGQLQTTQKTAQRSTAATAASIGRGAARAATAVGAIGVGSIVAAAKFEDAFADVRKTVDATEPEFDRLEKGLRDMAKEIPVGVQELSRLAGQAGALGVETKNLLKFTRTAADLGVATDLSAEQAATALAGLAKIMETKGVKGVQRMGATLVDLGNKGASTESEISEMALRIAGAGKTIGLTEAEVLGFAAALANVRIRAEQGGSAISKVMLQMQDSVARGGETLESFAEIAGVAPQKFADLFAKDAPKAVALFAAGLDKVVKSGGSVMQTLEGVELNDIRVRDTLLRLAGATGEVTRAQDIANKAWGENSALAEEANKRYATTSSQFEVLKNRVFDLGISFGQDLLPKVNDAMKALGKGKLDKAITVMAGLGADMAGKLIGAFVKAWWESDLLAKLFLTGAFIRLIGGRGVFGAIGLALGKLLVGGLATSTVAQTAASSGRFGRAGSLAGAAFRGSFITAAIVGLIGAIESEGGLKTLHFDGIIPKTDAVDPKMGPILKKIADQYGGLNQAAREMSAEQRNAFRSMAEAARDSGDITREEFAKVSRSFGTWRDTFRAMANDKTILRLQDNFDFLRQGIGASMKDIMRITDQGSKIIRENLGSGSKQGREALAENFRLAVGAIRTAMKRGDISTKEGMARIKQLISQANIIDPTRKQARAFGREWAKGMNQSEEITAKGIDRMLNEMGKMPPKARDIAANTMLKWLHEAKRGGDITVEEYRKIKSRILLTYSEIAEGVDKHMDGMNRAVSGGIGRMGKNVKRVLGAMGLSTDWGAWGIVGGGGGGKGRQRGGPIGGSGTGDKVPAMLEPGEFVVNKKATKQHRALVEKINQSPARFQAGGLAGPTGRMANKFVQQFGGSISSGLRPGDDGFHGRGLAFDWVGGDWNKAARYANQIGSKLLEGIYSGSAGPSVSWDSGKQVPPSFWGGPTWAGHADHIHIAIGQMVKGAVGAAVKKLKRVVLKGPDGALKDMGQGALDKTWKAANKYLAKMAPEVGVESGVTKGMMSKPQIASVWRQANRGEGNPNLMAAIALAESAGNPRAVGDDPGGTQGLGLWQITTGYNDDLIRKYGGRRGMFNAVNNAQAAGDIFERQGLNAWVVYSSGAYRQHLKQGGVVDRTGVQHQAIAAPYVGAFKDGGEVPKTGLAMVHKGEQITSKKDTKGLGLERIKQIRGRLGDQINKVIPKLDERIDIAQQLAGLSTSPQGSELSKGELNKQIGQQKNLLAVLKKTLDIAKRGMQIVQRTIERIEDQIKKLERKIKDETKRMERRVERLNKRVKDERKLDKPDQKKIEKWQSQIRDIKERGARPLERWQEDLGKRAKAMQVLPGAAGSFREAITEMSGLTGRGGRVFEASLALKELRASGKPQAIGISELLEFAEAMRFGAFKRPAGMAAAAAGLPTFHQGGVVPGPIGQSVPVMAKGGEVFLGPGQGGGGAPVVNVKVFVGDREITDIVRTEVSEDKRRVNSRYRAGVRP